MPRIVYSPSGRGTIETPHKSEILFVLRINSSRNDDIPWDVPNSSRNEDVPWDFQWFSSILQSPRIPNWGPQKPRLAAGDESAVTCVQKISATKDELDQGQLHHGAGIDMGYSIGYPLVN